MPPCTHHLMDRCSCHNYIKCPAKMVESIAEEDCEGFLPPAPPPAPETPTETMEFLARSWSVSAMELSKALTGSGCHHQPHQMLEGDVSKDSTVLVTDDDATDEPSSKVTVQSQAAAEFIGFNASISPRDNGDLKHAFRVAARGKTTAGGGWFKDHKGRRREEARTHNAQVYAATSVAGVAAAVAAIAAQSGTVSKTSAAIASAAALVASHCVEMAQKLGATGDQILAVVQSAVNVQSSGDVLALTAGAATVDRLNYDPALRAASTLRERLHKEIHCWESPGENTESQGCLSALAFVSQGGELLKRTRKGALHWKHVSIYVNSSWQVVVKMKSTHMAGTFVKKKKCVAIDVCPDLSAWPNRELGNGGNKRAYFGIKTLERLIEFECRNKCEKQMWVKGIRQMLNCRVNMNMPLYM